MLINDKCILVGSIEITAPGPKISTRSQVYLPTRTLAILNTKLTKQI